MQSPAAAPNILDLPADILVKIVLDQFSNMPVDDPRIFMWRLVIVHLLTAASVCTRLRQISYAALCALTRCNQPFAVVKWLNKTVPRRLPSLDEDRRRIILFIRRAFPIHWTYTGTSDYSTVTFHWMFEPNGDVYVFDTAITRAQYNGFRSVFRRHDL